MEANNPAGKEVKIYSTFICYRGSSIGHSVSQQISNYIYELIRYDARFGSVFYAGDTNVSYDFIKDAGWIIKNVKKFVIVLCRDFFKDFFINEGDPAKLALNPGSATALEFKYCFECGCDLCPVFSGEFSWNSVDKKTLENLESVYGKSNIEKLMHRANVYQWNQIRNEPGEIIDRLLASDVGGTLRFLRGLDDERTRQYELALTDFVKLNNTEEMRAILKAIIDDPDAENEDAVRYSAFYALQMMLRYNKDFVKMEEYFTEYGDQFSSHDTYNHIWLLFIMQDLEGRDPGKALRLAYEDRLKLYDNAGYVHLFPDLYARICEHGTADTARSISEEWGKRAREAAEKAIELDKNYAKYYCTLARILSIEGDYDEATRNVDHAIAAEDSRRKDYFIRLADYQYYKIMIQMEKRFSNREDKEHD